MRRETLTCYNGIKGDGCGQCAACNLRANGLNQYLADKVYAYQVKAEAIITGVCETDFSGYPDCRDEFVKALHHAVSRGWRKTFALRRR